MCKKWVRLNLFCFQLFTGAVPLTADNFTSVLSEAVAFVKFYAPWCGHCRRLAPTWDILAKEVHSSSNVIIAKVCVAVSNSSLLGKIRCHDMLQCSWGGGGGVSCFNTPCFACTV